MIATLYKRREDIKKKAKITDAKATIRDVVHLTLDGRKRWLRNGWSIGRGRRSHSADPSRVVGEAVDETLLGVVSW